MSVFKHEEFAKALDDADRECDFEYHCTYKDGVTRRVKTPVNDRLAELSKEQSEKAKRFNANSILPKGVAGVSSKPNKEAIDQTFVYKVEESNRIKPTSINNSTNNWVIINQVISPIDHTTKTTKAMNIPYFGHIVQTETESGFGSSQSMVSIPGVYVKIMDGEVTYEQVKL